MIQPRSGSFFSSLILVFLILICSELDALAVPRPEYPRPDFKREAWLNLNGIWSFAETNDPDISYLDQVLPEKILVPFCRESSLSGLARKDFVKYVWYQRDVFLPEEWKGKQVLFNIGASDWETTVWVNQQEAGKYIGGNTPICVNISPFVQEGTNTITIRVYDDHLTGLQASGKQSDRLESYGCYYTRTTGIWQTVWLEAVSEIYIDALRIVPNPDGQCFWVSVETEGFQPDTMLEVETSLDGRRVGSATTELRWRNTLLTLPVETVQLWEPGKPILYDLVLSLIKDGKILDRVQSYSGMRKVEIQGQAILINDKLVFQRLVLDQGFYPEGIWTAPSQEALIEDIELSMAAGFNGARLHQKVFEPLFLFHADRLGYLVWGEYPNWGLACQNPAIDIAVVNEWTAILDRDANHPAIIGWCPFNESSPSAGRIQRLLVDLTRKIDPTRPILETSGWTHTHPDPEVLDAHDYDQNPVSYQKRWNDRFERAVPLPQRFGIRPLNDVKVPFFVSEFGGIGWDTGGDGWGYGHNPKTLDEFYARFEGLVSANLDQPNFFGYCYTQLYDIEQEKNGIYTYQRKPKFDIQRLKSIQARPAAYEQDPPLAMSSQSLKQGEWKTLLASSHERDLQKDWKYTLAKPAEEWIHPDYDDSHWEMGRGGFGNRGEELLQTHWESPDIWIRTTFDYDGRSFNEAVLLIWYDNATHIFLNGEEIWNREGWVDEYVRIDMTPILKEKLHPGTNTLAVHTNQETGGQYIDLGLLIWTEE